MDVFVMVRRKKTTLFLDAKENSTVLELKKMIRGILKVDAEEMQLFFNDNIMDDARTLADSGLSAQMAKAQSPATVGLALKEGDRFETLDITPLSSPPELPDVMKSQDAAQMDAGCA